MTLQTDAPEHPHRRYNPLTGDWVLVSPHRMNRPWDGADETGLLEELPAHDSSCPLCPCNQRANGDTNPDYSGPFVFANDFAALVPDSPITSPENNPLFRSESTRGESHVICYSPDHSKTLPELSLPEIRLIINTWEETIQSLRADYQWVQVFENKGEVMGCSQPHPHGQVWASSFIPNEITRKDKNLKQYYESHGSNLLIDYVEAELEDKQRVVTESDNWVVVVPYWAAWPFETLLLPKLHIREFTELSNDQKDDLAKVLRQLTCRYDNLFNCSFPYSMGWHFAPFNDANSDHWQLHAMFYPPLLRSATVKKFMVGYEMLAEPQRDLTPEAAAQLLQEKSDQHYKVRL